MTETTSAHIKVEASLHSVGFTHLHRLVLTVGGSGDEPAAVLHRLKLGQGLSVGSLIEEETLHVPVGADHLQVLLAAFLFQSGRDGRTRKQSYREGPSQHFPPQLLILTLAHNLEHNLLHGITVEDLLFSLAEQTKEQQE